MPNSAAHPEPLKRRTLSPSSSRRPGGRERSVAERLRSSDSYRPGADMIDEDRPPDNAERRVNLK
jgi:hypothetical protein